MLGFIKGRKGSISLWNDRPGFGATTGGLPLPDGSMSQSEILPEKMTQIDHFSLGRILIEGLKFPQSSLISNRQITTPPNNALAIGSNHPNGEGHPIP